MDHSRASIFLRRLRISNQLAPVDVNLIPRVGSLAGSILGYGGAFEYAPQNISLDPVTFPIKSLCGQVCRRKRP